MVSPEIRRSVAHPITRLFLRLRWPLAALLALYLWARLAPMDPLFSTPRSTVLLDRDGRLLGAAVAADGQWRMPAGDSIPARFERCLLEFEDRRFRSHWGVRIPSLVRAFQQNRRAGRTVSGGSTLTMQLARMAGGDRPRSYGRKLLEMLHALRIEAYHDKDTILALYCANAPFGANVVGLEAAAWRWFGRDPHSLSWAEAATLAVLPNAPARIHPGSGREALRAKRDRLLARLLATGDIDSLQWSLAVAEPLPDAPHALPRLAPHLLGTMQRQGRTGQRIRTTLRASMQERVTMLAARHAPVLAANEVHNAAVLVLDLLTGEVLAYVGNLPGAGPRHAGEVDIVQAPRSTGSLLKPFLYASMLQSGELMPMQLVADLPTQYDGFAPRNFDQRYDGAVPAAQALARSLNVPAVRALHRHGIERTLRVLRAMGLGHIDRSAEHYGLSLVVGGAESTLWELTGAYASMGRIVQAYNGDPGRGAAAVHGPVVVRGTSATQAADGPPPLTAGAVHHTIQALQLLNRPDMEAGWQHFTGGERIAWKTGTSFGHRDAWAIGITDRYAVGVWTGNASGEGRPGLTGSLAAAPLLFEVFGMLPNGHGFDVPHDELLPMAVCRASGHRAGADCGPVDTLRIIARASRTTPCPYHQRILLNAAGTHRATPGPGTQWASWFVLPPAMEHYYMASHPGHRPLPPWEGRSIAAGAEAMEMIYPERGARILLPLGLQGTHNNVVLEAAHRDRSAQVHWDLDGHYLGSTTGDHRITASPGEGMHQLTLTDDAGNTLRTSFTVRKGG